MIQQFNKQNLPAFRDKLLAALQLVATAEGVTVQSGKCRYMPPNFASYTFDFSVLTANGTPVSKEAELFRVNADLYGFQPDDLGRKFTDNGKVYEIVGLNPKARTKPILLKGPDGGTYTGRADGVRTALERSAVKE